MVKIIVNAPPVPSGDAVDNLVEPQTLLLHILRDDHGRPVTDAAVAAQILQGTVSSALYAPLGNNEELSGLYYGARFSDEPHISHVVFTSPNTSQRTEPDKDLFVKQQFTVLKEVRDRQTAVNKNSRRQKITGVAVGVLGLGLGVTGVWYGASASGAAQREHELFDAAVTQTQEILEGNKTRADTLAQDVLAYRRVVVSTGSTLDEIQAKYEKQKTLADLAKTNGDILKTRVDDVDRIIREQFKLLDEKEPQVNALETMLEEIKNADPYINLIATADRVIDLPARVDAAGKALRDRYGFYSQLIGLLNRESRSSAALPVQINQALGYQVGMVGGFLSSQMENYLWSHTKPDGNFVPLLTTMTNFFAQYTGAAKVSGVTYNNGNILVMGSDCSTATQTLAAVLGVKSNFRPKFGQFTVDAVCIKQTGSPYTF